MIRMLFILKTIDLYAFCALLLLTSLLRWCSMATVTVSVPDGLKDEMGKADWINWSSVARKAFVETLRDVKELELKKKVREISEIAEDDDREIKEEIVKDVMRSADKAMEDFKSGKLKGMTLKELKELMAL